MTEPRKSCQQSYAKVPSNKHNITFFVLEMANRRSVQFSFRDDCNEVVKGQGGCNYKSQLEVVKGQGGCNYKSQLEVVKGQGGCNYKSQLEVVKGQGGCNYKSQLEVVKGQGGCNYKSQSDNEERVKTVSYSLICKSAAIHVIRIILGYTLMLCVMTMNIWIIVSVLVGCAIGYFLSRPWVYTTKASRPRDKKALNVILSDLSYPLLIMKTDV
ncbi:SLC31A2 [Mytilus coruscus]|uniref:Copper transport protein n=1 Tax=Mytilus coruscus TaxID=42192 RepID=A0A6J8BFM7_MYTCO|nr:SLC31A2 [Mytilus coruscus]